MAKKIANQKRPKANFKETMNRNLENVQALFNQSKNYAVDGDTLQEMVELDRRISSSYASGTGTPNKRQLIELKKNADTLTSQTTKQRNLLAVNQ